MRLPLPARKNTTGAAFLAAALFSPLPLSLCPLPSATGAGAGNAAPFRWDTTGGGANHYALVGTAASTGNTGSDGKIVWRFNADLARDSKPYFDPLAVAGGPSLTLPRPADHPWHLGHWFSWKLINGVNYWEEDKRGRAAGITEWDAPTADLRPDFSAAFTLNLRYRPRPTKKDATPPPAVLAEHRVITVSAPAADGSYRIDWTQKFTALADARLDRTPVSGEPRGTSWGGYAGLSVRLSNSLKNVTTIASTIGRTRYDNRRRMDVFGAPAVEQSGEIDGRAYGLAVLAHPSTARSGDWYLIEQRNFTYTNAATLLKGPLTLRKGETLTLRHRVIVHPDRWTPEQLRAAAGAYAAETTGGGD